MLTLIRNDLEFFSRNDISKERLRFLAISYPISVSTLIRNDLEIFTLTIPFHDIIIGNPNRYGEWNLFLNGWDWHIENLINGKAVQKISSWTVGKIKWIWKWIRWMNCPF